MQDDAPDRRLDMGARAAEPVVEIEIAEGGVDVIIPKAVNRFAAEPDAFRITGRTADLALGFRILVDIGAVGVRGGLLIGRRRRRIVLRGHGWTDDGRTNGRTGGQERGCGKEPHGNSGERRRARQ